MMPMIEENMAILKDRQGRDVALKGVTARARLHGLMAEVEIEQSYRNPQQENIEAVYTFPLPLGAVLLGLEVEIAGKKLKGQVIERKQAERKYEDAVTDGDSAVMLEESGPGLFTASLGNLMASESAVIRYRYGLLLSWQGKQLRFLMPTTIAPRYGDALAAGLRPHQVPSSSMNVEYPLDLSILIEGELASADISCPTHKVTMGRCDTGIRVQLANNAVLDRDFVLTLVSRNIQSNSLLTADGEGMVALASLRIPQNADDETKPAAIKVLIDCSGSMGGISIAQARKAALEILNQLRPSDTFNITLFGSKHEHLFPTMVPSNAKFITQAWNRLELLDADMGGTEMEKALDAVFSLSGTEGDAAVLLITDGEIHEHEKLVGRAQKSGHRVFVVGVGTAVAEVFLRKLASATGGACELVSPQEGMSERVLAQFHRMRQPKLGNLSIKWPSATTWQTPLPDTAYAGDTVHVFAGFANSVQGDVELCIGEALSVMATLANGVEPEIPRVAAALRMANVTEADALRIALDYQLLSKFTNYLVVAERADKAEELPELHQVPHMLAAGWGATGSMAQQIASGRGSRFSPSRADGQEVFSLSYCVSDVSMDKYDIPAFLRRRSDCGDEIQAPQIEASSSHVGRLASGILGKISGRVRSERLPKPVAKGNDSSTPAEFISSQDPFLILLMRDVSAPKAIDDLVKGGLDKGIADDLQRLAASGYDETILVICFIYALSESTVGHLFDRAFKRVILKAWKSAAPDPLILAALNQSLGATTVTDWNWATVQLNAVAVP